MQVKTESYLKRLILSAILFHISIGILFGQPGTCTSTPVSTSIGGCLPTQNPMYCNTYCDDIDDDFASDCPNCFTDQSGDVTPCFLKGVNGAGATGVDFKYVLIFDDDFNGDAIDLSKWFTSNQATGLLRVNGSTVDYDNGTNFQFDHPGVEEIDKYSSFPITYNGTLYYYTSSQLMSQYQFPLFNNSTYSISIPNLFDPDNPFIIYPYSYGIYQLTCTLPQVQPSIGYSWDPPYASSWFEPTCTGSNDGSIWPAYWMWGVNESNSAYGEIDGFEFTGSEHQDGQTIHGGVDRIGCGLTTEPNYANFGDGGQRTYYTLYTPDEVDWWADGLLTQSVTKYYGENDPLIGSNTYYPIYNPTISSGELITWDSIWACIKN